MSGKSSKAAGWVYLILGVFVLLLVGSGSFEFKYGPLGLVFCLAMIIFGLKNILSKNHEAVAVDDPELRIYMDEVIKKYELKRDINNGVSMFVGSSIPEDRLSRAKKAYGQSMAPFERVFFLYDDTVFASGKKGIMVTEQFLYLRLDDGMVSKDKVPLSAIDDVKMEKKALAGYRLLINGSAAGSVSSPEPDKMLQILKAILAAYNIKVLRKDS